MDVFWPSCSSGVDWRRQREPKPPSNPPLIDPSAAASSTMPPVRTPVFVPTIDFDQAIQPPAGPPPTPRHTGIKALVKGLVVDFKYLPSRENLMWAGLAEGWRSPSTRLMTT